MILLPIFVILFFSDIEMAVSNRGPGNNLIFHDHAFSDSMAGFPFHYPQHLVCQVHQQADLPITSVFKSPC